MCDVTLHHHHHHHVTGKDQKAGLNQLSICTSVDFTIVFFLSRVYHVAFSFTDFIDSSLSR